MTALGQAIPDFVQLAAHPVRWRLMTALAAGDHRVRELVEHAGERQSLVSYHLRLLRDGGVVTARRSSHDARDTYYHLDLDRCAALLAGVGPALHPVLRHPPEAPPAPRGRVSVLFACTGNTGRSPIAEALLRSSVDGVDVLSAGSHPKQRMHPLAVRVLREEYGVDLGDRRPRGLDGLRDRSFDYVITLCDKVREVCPEFPGHPRHVHWSIPDPAADPSLATFRDTAAEIATRVRHLIPVLGTPATG